MNHQVVIVCGETGSGKTTQLPKMCLSLGRGLGAGGTSLIGHTQPRRLAATSTAKRIAEELNTDLGEVVGYKIRFADRLHEGASVAYDRRDFAGRDADRSTAAPVRYDHH